MRTPPLSRIGFAALLAVTMLTMSCQLRLQPLAGSVEAAVDDAIDRGFDGIIVHIDQPGGSRFYSAGWDDRRAKVPADPHRLFKIASISKLYVAAATTMLVADGDLSLDATLAKLVPEVVGEIDNAEAITLRMLLQHRSGIPDYIFRSDFTNDPEDTYLDTASLLYGQPANFEPGARYGYSNSNYLLIGEILDRTLEYSHHAYVASEILEPLALNDTYSLLSEVDPDDVMSGYVVGYGPDVKTEEDHTRPGGSMVATAEDVGRFVRALVDGSLLTPEEQAIYDEVYEYEHTGWVNGYTSIVRYHPDIDAVVVQFVNTSYDGLFWIELERVYGRIVDTLEREQ
ncbi:MAG: serine hydrolase domain-containing protein [Myxococcota bacterium]